MNLRERIRRWSRSSGQAVGDEGDGPPAPMVNPERISKVPRTGDRAKGQQFRRKLRFRYVATYATPGEALRFVDAATEVAEARASVPKHVDGKPAMDWRIQGATLDLHWTYGWVKGGWVSDGERFVRAVHKRAGVTPTSEEPVRILREEKERVEEPTRG